MFDFFKYSRRQVLSSSRAFSVHICDSYKNSEIAKSYSDNTIITTRYTWWNFFIISLCEQFSKSTNLWFLLLLILYNYSQSSIPFYISLVPLVIVVGFSMLKNAYDDIKRHFEDRIINKTQVPVLYNEIGSPKLFWKNKNSQDINVGDFIRVDNEQEFPCDLLAIASSNANREITVITANLDGETNLKKLKPVSTPFEFLRIISKEFDEDNPQTVEERKLNYKMDISYQNPIKELDVFNGGANLDDHKKINFLPENLLLRGAKLRQTEFVVGLAVYTGKDTKLSLNIRKSCTKFSVSEKKINFNVLFLISACIFLSIFLKIIEFAYFYRLVEPFSWYLPYRNKTAWLFVEETINAIFIFSYLVPISIIISFEIGQIFAAAVFINKDKDLYDTQNHLQGEANTMSLADQLGQIEFLFSDKTGTLTQNLMVFKACTIVSKETVYYKEDSKLIQEEMNFLPNFCSPHSQKLSTTTLYEDALDSPYEITTRKVLDHFPKELKEFWTMVALCNTVIVDDNTVKTSSPIYNAASPDEEALVIAAAEIGIKFTGTLAQLPIENEDFSIFSPNKSDFSSLTRKSSFQLRRNKRTASEVEREHIAGLAKKRKFLISPSLYPPNNLNSIDPNAQELIFEVDDVIEFNSDRKRMTILCTYPDGSHYVLSKGAETSMIDPCASYGSTDDERSRTLRKVNDFAIMGLRTLVFSMKKINDDETYEHLLEQLTIARSCTSERRDSLLNAAIEAIENGMTLIGVTGVEDKLQDNVKETLISLRESGIQIWVLTGDKEETAVSVSQAAGHFPQNLSLVRITDCDSLDQTLKKIVEQTEGLNLRLEQKKQNKKELSERIIIKFNSAVNTLSYRIKHPKEFSFSKWLLKATPPGRIRRRRRKHAGAAGEGVGIVIDGKSLKYALEPVIQDLFLELCMNSTTVLCCRVTPLQKAGVVKLVSEGIARNSADGRPPITAAIGDGGNDVSMILQADVGIGLYGKEGLHAVRASDYALAKFSHLKKLILIHGSYTYQRLSLMMLYFYFKNTAIMMPDAYQEIMNGWSDQAYYLGYYYSVFNLTMTSITTLSYGIMDRFLSMEKIFAIPRIYRAFTRDLNLRTHQLFLWMLMGLWHGTTAYFVGYLFLAGGMGSPAVFYSNGVFYDLDRTVVSVCIYIYLWISVSVHLWFMFRTIDCVVCVIFALTLVVNIGIFYFFQGVLLENYNQNRGDVIYTAMTSNFWIGLLLHLSIALIPTFIWKYFRDWYWRVEVKYAESFAYKNN